MRVLAFVPGGIGDQVLFFPTLDDLKNAYPEATIDVVVEPRAKGAYRVCQSVRDTLLFDFKDANSPADWINLLGNIRDREYDVALSLGSSWAVGVLLWLTGIQTRVGFVSNTARLLTNPVPLKRDQYAAQMYHDLLQGLGIHTPCPNLRLTLPKQDLDWAEAEKQRLNLSQGYIILHGGSSQVAKNKGINRVYTTENWRTIVAESHRRQPSINFLVIQGPDDQDFVADLRAAYANIKVTQPSDIGKLAAMIAGANLLVSTDSAPLHLAVATQTYVVGLFGPTDPSRSLPQSDRVKSVKSPTGKMVDIPPTDVLTAIWGR